MWVSCIAGAYAGLCCLYTYMAKDQLNVIPEILKKQIISLYQDGKSYKEIYSYPGIKKNYIIRLKNQGLLVPRTLKEAHKLRLNRDGPNKMGLDARKKLSIQQSLKNRGGKSKWFLVKGVKVQGTWEKKVAEKLTDLNIKWIKPQHNKDVIEYTIDNKIRRYTPDFYLPEYNQFLEIKGYYWNNDKLKMQAIIKQHPNKKIFIMRENDYKKFLCGELVWL